MLVAHAGAHVDAIVEEERRVTWCVGGGRGLGGVVARCSRCCRGGGRGRGGGRNVQVEEVAVHEFGRTKVKIVKVDSRAHELGEAGVIHKVGVQFDVVVDAVRSKHQAHHRAQVAGARPNVQKRLVRAQLERLQHSRVYAWRRYVYMTSNHIFIYILGLLIEVW